MKGLMKSKVTLGHRVGNDLGGASLKGEMKMKTIDEMLVEIAAEANSTPVRLCVDSNGLCAVSIDGEIGFYASGNSPLEAVQAAHDKLFPKIRARYGMWRGIGGGFWRAKHGAIANRCGQYAITGDPHGVTLDELRDLFDPDHGLLVHNPELKEPTKEE